MQGRRRYLSVISIAIVSVFALTAQMPAGSTDCCNTGAVTYESVKNENFDFDFPEDGCHPVRFHQARYLIEECRDFIKTAKPLHERMQEQILLAKTLKGRADMLMNNMPAVAPPKLQGKALEAAVDEYKKSLQAFVDNADKYRLNLQAFRNTIGECQRAQAAYDRQRQLYNLHCNQFHVTGLAQIEAPRICPPLNVTEGEASHIANQIRADEQRLREQMSELNTRSALLNESRSLVAANLTNTATEAVRQREEEKLVKEFGRLREEYEMLKIQSTVLGTTKQIEAGKTIRRSVSGKVVNK